MSTNQIITKNSQYLHSLKEKTLGLLDSNVSRVLIFKTRFGIHTFGMKQPIDVLILDSNHIVQKLRIALKPNEMFFWNPLFDVVIELPAGIIKHTKTKVGDQIKIV